MVSCQLYGALNFVLGSLYFAATEPTAWEQSAGKKVSTKHQERITNNYWQLTTDHQLLTISFMTAEVQPETALQRASAPVRARTRVRVHKTRAPFSLRCGALLIDYIVLVAIVAASTLIARMLGRGGRIAGNSTETFGLVLALLVAILNFGLFAGLWGQTIGKWATGLRIERTNGHAASPGRIALRHFVGYPLSILTLGIGFLLAALNSRGRALHDLIADTVVVHEVIERRYMR